MEKRNIFSLFRIWLKRQGGQAALQALVQEAEAGVQGREGSKADGTLDPYEVQQLLKKVWHTTWIPASCRKHPQVQSSTPYLSVHIPPSSHQAVPDVSSLEAQMFMAMVDVNNDGILSLQELQDGLFECREVDAVVSGAAGDDERRKQAEASMAAMVQSMRTKATQLAAGLQTTAAQRGGYVTFQVTGRSLGGFI